MLFKNFDWSMNDAVFSSMLWYGVVLNSIVFCSVLLGSMVCYILVEYIQSVL